MDHLAQEYRLFLSCPWNMRVLLVTNLIYALVLPIIELFVGAYVMRNSNDVKLVITYQIALYTGIPVMFFLNGWLLRFVGIARLYSVGMLLSGVSMAFMMSLGQLTVPGLVIAGLVMGMSFGLYWANRDFLALSTTDDSNRNYYYGLETFFGTNVGIVIPLLIGTFIAASERNSWFGGHVNHAYQIITGAVFLLTMIASVVVHSGNFHNPPKSPFVYFRFHRLWTRMQFLAILKGIGSGYIVTAPAMLIMTLVGKEGTIGLIQSLGGILSAMILYVIGRTTKPRHRIAIFTVGLALFAIGVLPNMFFFNALGVLFFMACLLLARPLQDMAFLTIQLRTIDTVSRIEMRNEFAYIVNQEFGNFIGRIAGCILFILLANYISDTFALRYALPIVAVVQLLAIPIASKLILGCSEETLHSPNDTSEDTIPVSNQQIITDPVSLGQAPEQ